MNYATRARLLCARLLEAASGMALHPSGFMVALAHADRIDLHHLLRHARPARRSHPSPDPNHWEHAHACTMAVRHGRAALLAPASGSRSENEPVPINTVLVHHFLAERFHAMTWGMCLQTTWRITPRGPARARRRGALQPAARAPLRAAALLRYSHGGHRLAAVDASCCIHVLASPSGAPVAVLRGHASAVAGLAWAPCDRRLASAGAAGAAYLWDAATGARLPGEELVDKRCALGPPRSAPQPYSTLPNPGIMCRSACTS